MDDPKVTTIKGHITFYSPQRIKQNTENAKNSLQLTSHSPKKSTLEWEGYENFPLQFTVDVLPNHFCLDYSVSTFEYLSLCVWGGGGCTIKISGFSVCLYNHTAIYFLLHFSHLPIFLYFHSYFYISSSFLHFYKSYILTNFFHFLLLSYVFPYI